MPESPHAFSVSIGENTSTSNVAGNPRTVSSFVPAPDGFSQQKSFRRPLASWTSDSFNSTRFGDTQGIKNFDFENSVLEFHGSMLVGF